jgi:hypothetical protein
MIFTYHPILGAVQIIFTADNNIKLIHYITIYNKSKL